MRLYEPTILLLSSVVDGCFYPSDSFIFYFKVTIIIKTKHKVDYKIDIS